jgi:tetratricopeptide (TPR) repeat protein
VQQSPLRVFVSSTWLDLQPERQAVEAALQRLRTDTGFNGMEYFGSRDVDTRRASLDEVDRCHLYVGIFAARYGSGITEDEYRRARELNLPCFIYFKNESTITLDKAEKDPQQTAKLETLKAELQRTHTVAHFDSPADLAAKVLGDLHRWLVDEYLPRVGVSQTSLSPSAALHQLRAAVSDFVGREKEIEFLIDALRTVCSAGISGMGGIGKTELSLLVASRLRSEYPDAQLFIDMRGTDEKPLAPADALAACIRAFHGADAKLPDHLNELIKIYRTTLDGKRALILLDNAADSAQVLPLRPPAGCALLVTSRETLALPGMKRLTLEQLQPTEARDLLISIAPRTPQDSADRICYLCGYLPLALRAAGSLIDITPDLDPAAYATQLHDERERLKLIGREGVDLDVEASFQLSYARLQPDAARVFRHLAVFPASFDAPAEEEICQDAGHAHLTNLLRRNLVLYNTVTKRYRLHDLARLFADSRLTTEERFTIQAHHAACYLGLLWKIDDLYKKGGAALTRALMLFDTEWTNVQAGQSWAASNASDNDTASQLCCNYPKAGIYMFHLRLHPQELVSLLETALFASRKSNDRAAEGHTLGNLGVAYRDLGEPRRAVEANEQALAIVREIGDQRGESHVLANLGNAYKDLGKTDLAVQFYEQHFSIARKTGDQLGEVSTLCNLGILYRDSGEPSRAIEIHQRALTICREIGDRRGEGNNLWNLSLALDQVGERVEAIASAEAALKIREMMKDPRAVTVREALAEWRRQGDEG